MLLVFYILSGVIVFQLTLPFLTVLAAQLWGKERLESINPSTTRDYACIITAYKNAAIAIPLLQSLLKQTYPKFQIYLVADHCPSDFTTGIQDERISVFIPEPPLNLKAKSIIYAMERYQRAHNYTVVFDADNLAHPAFLETIDAYAQSGYLCIQGRRTAKNTENQFAAADALGEHYKNYIERYAPYLLGSSSVISGSGMATETNLYKAYLDSPAIQQGQYDGKKMLQEDKILQNFLITSGHQIAYAQAAICYDEKVESAHAVQTQRSRWLFSYFQNLPNTLQILFSGIINMRWNTFFFGLVTLSLPMFIQVGIAGILFLVGFWWSPLVSAMIAIALVVFSATVLWTLALSGHPELIKRAVFAIPSFMGRQVLSLFKMANPNKNFQHTEHKKVVSVDELLDKE